MKKRLSRYQEIALDIATLIINGEISEGERISGSATFSTRYGVSPETIRKAIVLLKESGVVTSAPKSGVKVLSTKKALEYIGTHQNRTSFVEIKSELEAMMVQRSALDRSFLNKANSLINQLSSKRDVGIVYPLEATIPANSSLIDKSIDASEFWHKTSATIIAVCRDDQRYISPGPNWIYQAHDTLIFVGKSTSYLKVIDYLEQNKR